MARYLSVVETAYRATVEEQDDTGVWFTRAIQGAGAEVALLLCGDGVSYAQRGHNAGGLRFGTREVRIPPELDRDLEAMVGRGTRVYVVKEDLAVRGIPDDLLLPGLERVARAQIPRLFSDHDRILCW
jgi:hypothetical protein